MSLPPNEKENGAYISYEVQGLLAKGQRLVLNPTLNILTKIEGPSPLLEQQVLTPAEQDLIKTLLKFYPDYCPAEELLSIMNGKSPEQCRSMLLHALNEVGGIAFDSLMRPVRNVLSRSRMKLHPFGLDVRSVILTGYVLVPLEASIGRARQ